MKKPTVALTSGIDENGKLNINPTYLRAVIDAGGIPVTLPPDPERAECFADEFDAFLFTGGEDVDPKRYGEEPDTRTVKTDARRDAFEFALFDAVKDSRKPILGICRGC